METPQPLDAAVTSNLEKAVKANYEVTLHSMAAIQMPALMPRPILGSAISARIHAAIRYVTRSN